MIRSKPALVALAVFAAAGISAAALVAQNRSAPASRNPAPDQARPPVSVTLGKAEHKAMPVRLESIGAVQTMASVTVKSRVDSQIAQVFVMDGAIVKAGDVLFKLDSRQTEAQLKQAEANLARDRASLQQATSELRRQEELARRDYATAQKLETARAQAASLAATVQGNEAAIDSLRVQLSYYTVVAPIPGRIGAVGLTAGNIARSGDNALPLATIHQIMPIYVSFAVPQRYLPDIREAQRSGTAKVLATPQGYENGSEGTIAFLDNAVDATTGTLTIRAIFDNKDELLWPGALCAVRLTLRTEPNAVVVPREALQTSQTGAFVFAVENGTARVRPVTVDRTVGSEIVISGGLNGSETIVLDGQLLLTEGARVTPRSGPVDGPPQGGSVSNRGSAT